MNKINITNYGHLKKIPNNVINDIYKLCFQNYRASLIIISSYKKERLKLHRSLLGVKGDGEGETALFPTFSCNGKNQ